MAQFTVLLPTQGPLSKQLLACVELKLPLRLMIFLGLKIGTRLCCRADRLLTQRTLLPQ
jgi:hypothetical protein